MLVNWNLSRNHVHGQVVDLALLLCTKHDSEHTLRPSRFVPIPSYYDQRRLNHSMSAALVSKTKSIYISFAHKNQLLFEGCHYDFQTDSILRELQPRYKSKLVTAQSNCRWPCLCPCWSKPSKLCKNAASRAPPLILNRNPSIVFRNSLWEVISRWCRSTGSNLDPYFAFCSLTNELGMFISYKSIKNPCRVRTTLRCVVFSKTELRCLMSKAIIFDQRFPFKSLGVSFLTFIINLSNLKNENSACGKLV